MTAKRKKDKIEKKKRHSRRFACLVTTLLWVCRLVISSPLLFCRTTLQPRDALSKLQYVLIEAALFSFFPYSLTFLFDCRRSTFPFWPLSLFFFTFSFSFYNVVECLLGKRTFLNQASQKKGRTAKKRKKWKETKAKIKQRRDAQRARVQDRRERDKEKSSFCFSFPLKKIIVIYLLVSLSIIFSFPLLLVILM